MTLSRISLIALSALFIAPAAMAEERERSMDDSVANPEVQPEAPDIDVPDPEEDTKNYVGMGSTVAYGTRGVVEAGGSLALSAAPDSVYFGADPTIGYFMWDNLELSAILGTQILSVDGTSSQRYSAILEPSLHQPINDAVFVFAGVGNGVALADSLSADGSVDFGYALVPRAGMQFLVGRSGIMNVGARYTFIFSDVEADTGGLQGQTVLAFSNAMDLQVGYTVMF